MQAKIYNSAKIVNEEKLSIGEYSQIDDFVFLNAGQETVIGRFVHIATMSSIIGGGKLYMEDFSGMSTGCRIITGSDDFTGEGLTNPTVPSKYTNVTTGTVKICKYAMLGTNVVVFPGVTIGEGATVAAGCIVRENLEPWKIYASVGNRCRPINVRKKERIQELEQQLLAELGI